MDMNEKLEKIKKSCKIGKTVCRILFIIALVGVVLTIVGAGFVLSQGGDFEQEARNAYDSGYVTTGMGVGVANGVLVNIGDPDNLESSIPALQKAMDENPYTVMILITILAAATICFILAVILKLIESVFSLIEKEENPFTDVVIKRVLTVMIIISALMLFGTGAGLGILGFIITWVVYTIMDYGRMLQIQSDETL
ncbi:MAG: hypothetical protein K6A38_09900 [Lachnospiraceae bacterium]|nr:hypothetical protein [Lachnospiraceae bacterium]